MATIPLPVEHLVTGPNPALQGVQVPNMIQNYAELIALKQQMQEAPMRMQALQQQAQLQQQQIQLGQQNIAARQALNQAYSGAITRDAQGNPDIDEGKLAAGLANGPAAYQTPEVMKAITAYHKDSVDLQTSLVGLREKSQDLLGSAAAAIKAANYDPVLAHSFLDQSPPGPQRDAWRAQIDNPQALRQWVDQAIAASPKQRELQAQETTAGARQTTAQTEQQKLTAQMNPQSSLYAPSAASVALGTAPGAAAIQQGEARQAAIKAGAEAQARQPFEMALAAQKQALSQGDPNAAAQLLVSNNATLGELKSRGATPDFIARTLNAASQLSRGQYNAQAAEAQYEVAKSPANVGFFGSAKSLTDPGGTLDQLAAAAKDIPQHQFPIFNTWDDALKAAQGSGPIAKYATIALSAADDWAKVQGGGVGSDSSREQSLKRISASLSPEGRAGSIEGIRGGVLSQINSRIGNNPVLKRMYGDVSGVSGGTVMMRAPNGQTKAVPADQVDHYKQMGAVEVK